MILGISSGQTVATLSPWCRSARRVYDGPIVLLSDTPLPELKTRWQVSVEPAQFREDGRGLCDLTRTRWREIAHWLDGFRGPVALVDTRDAIFQSDPIPRIGQHLMIGTEHKLHRENAWCSGWVRHVAGDAWVQTLAQEPVLCAGALGGPAPLLAKFARYVFDHLGPITCHCTTGQAHMADQALINVLLRGDLKGWATITDDWVFHVMSMDAEHPPEADLVNNVVVRPDGVPFPIVHQADRAPQLAFHYKDPA